MNKTIKGLLATTVACSSFLGATLESDRTFIAHRDELASRGMQWASDVSTSQKKCEKSCAKTSAASKKEAKEKAECSKDFGATFKADIFYGQSTNYADMAYRFGMGTTGAIKVTQGVTSLSDIDTVLYNTDIQHSPNSDGSSASTLAASSTVDLTAYDRIPASGTLNLSPRRQVYGAYLGWQQSLDALLEGLYFDVLAPVVQVRTSMRPTVTNSVLSAIPPVDGKSGVSISDYFSGALSTNIATYARVSQAAMTKCKIDNTFQTATGLADLELKLGYATAPKQVKGMKVGVEAAVQVPTGNIPDMTRMFEAVYGARGHVGAGANGFVHFDLMKSNDIQFGFDALVNWKYFFSGTEKRTMGIYDATNKAFVQEAKYHQVMQHGVTGVQPAANVLTLDHTVTPRNQVEFVAGFTAESKNFSARLGYNLYWHQTELVAQKAAWTNDKYAFAHPHYSMETTALGYDITGGTSYTSGDEVVNQNGYVLRNAAKAGNDYNDPNSSVGKHAYYIGANADASSGTPFIITFAQVDGVSASDDYYPGAYTSLGGPIQKTGVTTSALANRVPNTDAFDDTDEEADITTAGGVDTAGDTTLTVRFNVDSTPAVTTTQITHSVVGGASYRIPGKCPIVIGGGAQAEFQASTYNSALEGFKVWASIGISF